LKSGRNSMPEYLLSPGNLKRFSTILGQYTHVFLFLDYDGTLAPFCDNPADAIPLQGTEDILDQLERKKRVTTGIISGRPVAELKDMLNDRKCFYVGLHGLEIMAPDGKRIKDQIKANQRLVQLRKYLICQYSNKKGFLLEDKGDVLTLHHPPDIDQDKLVLFIKERIKTDSLEVIPGRQIVEIRPSGWNKGKAVDFLVKFLSRKENIFDYLIIYIGDDSTDEDVFNYIETDSTVYVKNESGLTTAACYYVKDPREVQKLLKKIESLL
jgi:trehalose 6-phosphate phosphatase